MPSNSQNEKDTDEISSILSTIDALLSVSDRKDEIDSKTVPLSEMKIDEFRKAGFIEAQLYEIAKGMEQKLPIKAYADKQFNWMQMHEIRMGLMDDLDVSFYANPLFSASQMQEIRFGMMDHLDVSSYAKLMLSATDMRRIRKVLFAEAYKEKTKNFGKNIIDEETGILIRISDDCMQAFLQIPETIDFEPTQTDLLNVLKAHEVSHGILDKNLQDIVRNKIRGKEICVAQGKVPFAGKSGWYELFFKNCIEYSHYVPPDKEVDYSDVDFIESVTSGAMLAKYHPAQTDTDGMTVTAIRVEGSTGEDLEPLTGNGIRYDADTCTYFATITGYPTYSAVTSSLNVWNVYKINGDVSYLQSMAFDGIIKVSGSVQNLAVLRAKGDIIIDGFVEGAHIFSDQNVIIKGGVNGGEQGSVTAGGFVHGKFFENAKIQCIGNVEGNYFLNCNIKTDNGVFARGRKSRILGGNISAAYCIEAAIIGTNAVQKTIFEVGDTASAERRIADFNKDREEAAEKMQALEMGKQKLIMLLGEDAVQNNDLYNKTCEAIAFEERQLAEFDREIARLNAVMKKASKAYVKVHSKVMENMVFIINGSKKIIDRPIMRGITLTKRTTGNK